MRLFLSDSFFDKFTQLPRNIQRRVNDFQSKFRANSQSSAIHLEPLNGTRDSSLRSARVDQEYRAILGSLGNDNFMLLWVDKHDNAYRWAANKKFVWNDHTQSCQLVPVIEVPKETLSNKLSASQNDESWLLKDVDDEKLLRIGVPEELLPIVHSIKDLDDLDKNEQKLPQDVFGNLFSLLDGEDLDNLIAEIEEGLAADGEDTLLSNNNKRFFVEITSDEVLAEIMEQGMEKWQLFLHPSQRKLVDSDYSGTVKVSGSAGTGKTIAALHRLKHLTSQQGSQVLFTTYTTALSANLKELIDKLNIPSQRFELKNIDKVLLDVASANNILQTGYNVLDYSGGNERSIALWREVLDEEVSEFDEDFLYDEYIDVIIYFDNKTLKDYLLQSRTGRSKSLSRKQRLEIWKLKEKYEEKKRQRKVYDRMELFNKTATFLNEQEIRPYTNVIADEFQDFSNPELRFLRALVEEGRNDLFLTGDPYQRIYRNRKINFSSAGINVRGKRSRKLKVNYRTTEEIKRLAVSVVKNIHVDDLDGGEENNKGYISLMHGEIPVYSVYRSRSEEVKAVHDFINDCINNGIKLNDICIAAPSRQLYKEIQDFLHRNDFKYVELKGAQKKGDTDGISFCTFHSLKGLEFKIVILVGVNEQSMPSKANSGYPFNKYDASDTREYLASLRSLLYVAITRACQLVFITGYGEPTGLLQPTKTD